MIITTLDAASHEAEALGIKVKQVSSVGKVGLDYHLSLMEWHSTYSR